MKALHAGFLHLILYFSASATLRIPLPPAPHPRKGETTAPSGTPHVVATTASRGTFPAHRRMHSSPAPVAIFAVSDLAVR